MNHRSQREAKDSSKRFEVLSTSVLLFLSIFCGAIICGAQAKSSPHSIPVPDSIVSTRGGTASITSPFSGRKNRSSAAEGKNKGEMSDHGDGPPTDETLILFSDLDGTLIHYPALTDLASNANDRNDILRLPPSSTGMQGVVSSKTFVKIRDIRKTGTKVVLVSGMRTTTLLSRLPFLPRADAYCSEAGGRIFYATEAPPNKCDFIVKPKRFQGATPQDLKPFGLKEDAIWRSRMEERSGKVDPLLQLHQSMKDSTIVSDVCERDGLLWDFARSLMEQGYVLDTKGYSTCFRVNRKQQSEVMEDNFDRLANGSVQPWKGLTTSTNLGCVDFYPEESGKLNCCKYLAQVFYLDRVVDENGNNAAEDDGDNFLATYAVCMCDDDNDLEMALTCRHAYIPEVTSASMARLIDEESDHFTKCFGESPDERGVVATEKALSMIFDRIGAQKDPQPKFQP